MTRTTRTWTRHHAVPLASSPDDPLTVDGWTHAALPGLLFHQLPWLKTWRRHLWAVSLHSTGQRLIGELTAPTRAALVGACLDAEAHPRPNWLAEDLDRPACLAWLLDVMACLDLAPPDWVGTSASPAPLPVDDDDGPAFPPVTFRGETFDAPPMSTFTAWTVDSVCDALDGCTVEHDGTCPHGFPSWLRAVGLV